MTTQITGTIAINQCSVCSAELHAHDKYCRHCGISLTGSCVTSALDPRLALCETRPLEEEAEAYQPLSGALVKVVAQGVAEKARLYGSGRGGKRLIAVLATVPLWLLIVLLSPLEAYAAAKAIAKQV
jgi:hypothetical protein